MAKPKKLELRKRKQDAIRARMGLYENMQIIDTAPEAHCEAWIIKWTPSEGVEKEAKIQFFETGSVVVQGKDQEWFEQHIKSAADAVLDDENK